MPAKVTMSAKDMEYIYQTFIIFTCYYKGKSKSFSATSAKRAAMKAAAFIFKQENGIKVQFELKAKDNNEVYKILAKKDVYGITFDGQSMYKITVTLL